jgi:hypothetical protein
MMMSRKRARWPVMIFGAIAIFGGLAAWLLAQDPPAQTAARPTGQAPAVLQLRMDGIGPVTIGMKRAEAEQALGQTMTLPFPVEGTGAGSCTYGTFASLPDGIAFMLVGDEIARIDVLRGTVATPEGAWISNDEFAVAGLYGARASLSPHKYVEGHYITVTGEDPAAAGLRYVFETENGRVTRYRAGRLPEVEYVEGCS